MEEYKIHVMCKNISNIQSKVHVIVFKRWNKYLSGIYFVSCVYKNIKLHKHPQFSNNEVLMHQAEN